MKRRTLVAGIGNIFLSDDGFGVEVANSLKARPMPDGVRIAEFGIRGVHLAYELLDGYDSLVLIDAVPLGEQPGTVAVIEPDMTSLQNEEAQVMDAHSMNPAIVLGTLARLGGSVDKILIIGCQPGCLEEGMGLSAPVAAAVQPAVEMCCQVVANLHQTSGKETAA
jgi:hydrogenase maturation protease